MRTLRSRRAALAAPLVVATLMSASAPAAALPVIMEILYDGPGTDADDAFTELAGTPGMTLDGWTLEGVNGSNGGVYRTVSLAGAVIPADGLLVIATAGAGAGLLAVRDFVGAVDWQNGPDAVRLVSPSGDIVDALQYGVSSLLAAGEGNPADDVGAGISLSRDALATDTGDNAADFLAGAPTPGAGLSPPAPVPAVPPAVGVAEPQVLGLLIAGTAMAGFARRRRRGWRRCVPQSGHARTDLAMHRPLPSPAVAGARRP